MSGSDSQDDSLAVLIAFGAGFITGMMIVIWSIENQLNELLRYVKPNERSRQEVYLEWEDDYDR